MVSYRSCLESDVFTSAFLSLSFLLLVFSDISNSKEPTINLLTQGTVSTSGFTSTEVNSQFSTGVSGLKDALMGGGREGRVRTKGLAPASKLNMVVICSNIFLKSFFILSFHPSLFTECSAVKCVSSSCANMSATHAHLKSLSRLVVVR